MYSCVTGLFTSWNGLIFLSPGHGGSDGLHGYVPSLDHVVADTVSSAEALSLLSSSLS